MTGTGGPPLRPPVGFPEQREGKTWRAAVISLVVHGLLLLLILAPAVAAVILHLDRRSAGVAGRTGGGGGRGGGGRPVQETLRFVQTAPAAPPVPSPTPRASVPPVVVPPVKPPVVTPPPVAPPKPPPASVPPPTSSAIVPPNTGAAPLDTGGGAGLAAGIGPGTGPGTGGGTGAGTGSGAGNGRGPGTGGERAARRKAAADVVTVYGVDPPRRPRPFHLHAVFAVDARGKATLLSVNASDDADYNHAIRQRLQETRFKPATLLDGTPVPDTVAIDVDY